jgi:DNA-directed RNA polymerase specialized sigma54-like protein
MTNNKAREVNNPIIKQLLDETTAEELAKIDTAMTNNKQQTAVEQFATALYENGFLTGNGDEIQELLEKAKEMEKEQIINAFNNGENKSAQLYYNETYGGNNER